MMIRVFKLAILFMFVFIVGCGPLYLPAIYDSTPPISSPSEIKGEGAFFSGDYNQGIGFNPDESNVLFRASLGKSIGGSFYRIASSGFVYFGKYKVKQSTYIFVDREEKSYFGIGGDVDFNAFLPLNVVNVGIGLYGGIATELGNYASFWRRDNKSFWTYIIPFIFPYVFTQVNISESDKLTLRLGAGLPGYYSIGVSYFNIKYGGLWVGFRPIETKRAFSSGVSVRIK